MLVRDLRGALLLFDTKSGPNKAGGQVNISNNMKVFRPLVVSFLTFGCSVLKIHCDLSVVFPVLPVPATPGHARLSFEALISRTPAAQGKLERPDNNGDTRSVVTRLDLTPSLGLHYHPLSSH
jgi:hypothetical protein